MIISVITLMWCLVKAFPVMLCPFLNSIFIWLSAQMTWMTYKINLVSFKLGFLNTLMLLNIDQYSSCQLLLVSLWSHTLNNSLYFFQRLSQNQTSTSGHMQVIYMQVLLSKWYTITLTPADSIYNTVFSPFFSVGFRNNAATDPGCHSNQLLQQMDKGKCPLVFITRCLLWYIKYIACNINSFFTVLQRWPTVQDLAAATLEVTT